MTDEEERALMDKAGELAVRIAEGHKKLWHAWDLIRGTPEPKQAKMLQDWDRAVLRLAGLCDQVAKLGGACPWELEKGAFAGPERPCLACSVPNNQWQAGNCLARELEL